MLIAAVGCGKKDSDNKTPAQPAVEAPVPAAQAPVPAPVPTNPLAPSGADLDRI